MRKLTAYDTYLARLLLLSFFLPLRLQLLLLGAVSAFWLVRDVRSRLAEPGPVPLPHSWAWLLSGIYGLYVLSFLTDTGAHRSSAAFSLEQKASLLVLPFALMAFRTRTRLLLLNELPFFVYGCILTCLYANWHFRRECGWLFVDETSIVEYREHFDHLIDIHPTYMGIYLCFAVGILLVGPAAQQKNVVRWRVPLLFLLFTFMFLLMPKAPVVALLALLAYYGWLMRGQLRKLMPVGLALALAVAITYDATIHLRLKECLVLLGNAPTVTNGAIPNTISMRQYILNVDLQLLKQHWLTGTGPGYLHQLLTERYVAYSRAMNVLPVVYNTHNEYLNQWITFGLMGIGVFLVVLGVHISKALAWRNHLYIWTMVMLCTAFCTENVLSRQRGVVFYAFFTSLFFFNGIRVAQRKPQSLVESLPELSGHTLRPSAGRATLAGPRFIRNFRA